MAVKGGLKPRAERCREEVAGQQPQPRPRKRPEGYLQRAGPVDAAQERVGVQPGFQLAEGLVQKGALAGEAEGLGQQHKLRMPVQLPDQFVVAHAREIQIGAAAKIGRGGRNAVYVIAAPFDLRPGFNLDSQQGMRPCSTRRASASTSRAKALPRRRPAVAMGSGSAAPAGMPAGTTTPGREAGPTSPGWRPPAGCGTRSRDGYARLS